MRKFDLMFMNFSTQSRHLTWSHYCELLSFKDINEIEYYIKISSEQCLSKRELKEKIQNKEYQK